MAGGPGSSRHPARGRDRLRWQGVALPSGATPAQHWGLSLDVCSAGELAVARDVEFPPHRILLHGNVKTGEDLKAAIAYGLGALLSTRSMSSIRPLPWRGGGQCFMIRVTPVPGTGAYHHALASNYTMVCRPPLVGVPDGVVRLLVRRETEEDLLARDPG